MLVYSYFHLQQSCLFVFEPARHPYSMEAVGTVANTPHKRKLEYVVQERPCKQVKPRIEKMCPFSNDDGCEHLRFMYLNKGKWEPYSDEISASIGRCFAANKKLARFSFSGQLYAVSFLHMMQLNLKTAYIRSIAWVDGSGKLVLPAIRIEGRSRHWLSVLNRKPRRASSHYLKGDSVSSQQRASGCRKSDTETSSSECSDRPSSACSDVILELGNRIADVDSEDQEYSMIMEKFISGLGPLMKHTSVIGLHRCLFEGASAQARLKIFQGQEQAVQASRGDANVCFAWYGTSRKGISGIISHGFGRSGIPSHATTYGSGIYLTPEGNTFLSAVYSEADERETQFMLLCKVIRGRSEKVSAGSQQFAPTSEEYDTGVDNVQQPSQYIVWSTHMNTHILPHFIVTYKLSAAGQSVLRAKRMQLLSSVFCCSSCIHHSLIHRFRTCKSSGDTAEQDSNSQHSRSLMEPCNIRVDKSIGCKAVEDVNSEGSCSYMEPHSPWIKFHELFSMLKQSLGPCALVALQQLHSNFQAGKLPRKALVNAVRAVAGDALLLKCLMGKQMR
ncbi:hypothetical protein KP509_15G016800 [Ceratopteris richardii]|uniref:Poly [ADP-ribose] polymerase n=1 Tax=Ceratopteris richardii TaxID=49495 RepID=A0A8T2T1C5_CERRI|nr:hypothetical protein KP509_15G016800 [Ceratopteris richardii]